MINKILIKIKRSIWIYPISYSTMSLIVAVFIIIIDSRLFFNVENYLPKVLFTSVDLAKTILATIAGSLLTMTTFTFTITMVVLTMYSSQFSLRTLENFISDKTTMKILGVFMGGFIYSISSLLFMRAAISEYMVISATIGVIYSITCLAYFAIFIHHVAALIQAENLIDSLYRGSMERINEYKGLLKKGAIRENMGLEDYKFVFKLTNDQIGYIQLVDHLKIHIIAKDLSATIVFEKVIGQFVTENAVVFSIYSKDNITIDEELSKKLLNCITIGKYRNELQDFDFSMQKIVEIALRAISSGVNDPNTANHCIRILGVLLGLISDLENGYIVFEDDEENLKVVFEAIDFEKELYFTFYQIVNYGKCDVSIVLSIFKALRYAMENATDKNKGIIICFADYVWDHIDKSLKKGLDYNVLKYEKEALK
ncbi:Uncharacterized membrane protein [Peptoclostridium litorale DSM 5388]|uniref:DUF2254 domain-containing protein n=1 Tax=Peptoclostridium litorale DSM 5388 TaxID=1121324 RepID=A0A069RD68_PEPLI|nr:DUF2254 domain-containing protein [Peptoclostridium litorale]KDR94160.1 hypothetical protein CLIT_23c04330 [Peptoclostridium litorale DSM 5388]SIN81636.1 Uncharacterized membrane protein [Peptoclostridium litorale DSM 5388]